MIKQGTARSETKCTAEKKTEKQPMQEIDL